MYERGYTKGYTPPEIEEEKKPRRLLPRILFWFVIIALLTGGVIALRHPSLQITTVDVEGVEVLDPEIIKGNAVEYLSGKVLWVFPRSSVFLASSKKLEELTRGVSTRVQNAEVEKNSFQRVTITITEYKPSYVWCRYDEPSECYFMTDGGVVYSEAPQFSGAVYTRIIAGPEEALPFQALTASDLEKIAVYKSELPKKQIYPEVFMYRDGRMLTIIASTKTNPSTEILVLADTPAETILDSIAAALRTPEFSGQYQGGKKLLYIDLRTKNRVVYRFE
jgi:hypothetical protein